jgi:hypothetical protein
MRATTIAIALACMPLAACGPQGVGLEPDSREPDVVMEIDGAQVRGKLIPGMHTDVSGREYDSAEFEYPCRAGGDPSADADVALERLQARLDAQEVEWFTVNCELAAGDGGRYLTDYVRTDGRWNRKEATRKSTM